VRLDAIECSSCAGMQDWAVVRLAGMVEGYREKVLRDNGGKIAFFELEDLSGRVNVKVRGREIDGFAHLLTSGEPVLITGKVSFPRKDDDAPEDPEEGPREPTIFLNEVRSLSQVIAAETKVLTVRLHAERTKVTDLKRMKDLFIARRGECPVTVHLTLADGAEAMLSLGKDYKVEVGDPLLAGLERVFGEQVAELRN
jgi:DNA polymerase-3 subunit alpha